MRRGVVAVLILMMCGMIVESGKTPPPSDSDEPTGTLSLTGNACQLAMTYNINTGSNPDGYVRLYDWDSTNSKLSHTWSAEGVGGCLLGDVDNDGKKELASGDIVTVTTGSGKQQTTTKTVYLKIWENGDDSGSPTYSQVLKGKTYPCRQMALGNVDGDSANELILLDWNGTVEIWDFTHDDATDKISTSVTGPTVTLSDNGNALGNGGLEVGDSDNDGVDEILVGMSSVDSGTDLAVGIDYNPSSGTYSLFHIGSKIVDDITIADLNKDNANEVFLSGNIYNERVLILKYESGTYKEKINITHNSDSYYDRNILLQANDAADVDGCGKPEVVSGHSIGTTGSGKNVVWWFRWYMWKYNANGGWTEYSGTFQSKVTGQIGTMDSGDLDADSKAEIVYDGLVLKYTTDSSGNPALKNIQELAFTPVCTSVSIG